MRKSFVYVLPAACALVLAAVSCSKDNNDNPKPADGGNCVYILNEGAWGSNNAGLSRWNVKEGTLDAEWYSSVNGSPLGDVANDVIVTDSYIIIAVNGSNIIQFCGLDGKAVAATEAVPGPRKLVADPDGKYLYVTSYADNGYLAKIDLGSFDVVDTVHVGYEPEGVAWYDGSVYVANSGGYAYNGTHGYEQSISVVDAKTMTETARIDTGHYNLYGAFLQNSASPRYILVNASGDYGEHPASSFVFDCVARAVVAEYDFPATYATRLGSRWYVLGSSYSYSTNRYEYNCKTIDMNGGTLSVGEWSISGLTDMAAPYGIYMTSYGELFVTDAGDYKSRGTLYRYDTDGKLLGTEVAGVCPGHFAE